ncbi:MULTISPECIES: hypothetical protein [unclassified Pseudomonas]|uniref:hypothetical protein n=1 Tax=unclassified Pseudomonas TaxID=196821 RepID=UPI002AC9BFBF|nr:MULTISPECIES: hypothetical protein [unclassified Pseudomonas]MEB0040379.1 hypothetical protein [Pseudomonas sp. MH10]MEB0120880.1 hypothetical protein [Pseudomonas sp. CCI1.2]WPX61888.1 hypothetical protein RHM59_13050 [Pseudomonas sp. MH10]
MASNAKYRQHLQPSLNFLLPVAENRSTFWPIDLEELPSRHAKLNGLMADVIIVSEQLSHASTLLSREQKKVPLSELNFYGPPFSLMARLTTLSLAAPVAFIEHIRKHINEATKAYSDRVFSSSIILDSVPLILPPAIRFMEQVATLYAKQQGVNSGYLLHLLSDSHAAATSGTPDVEAKLASVRKAVATTNTLYIDTMLASGNMVAYYTRVSQLLNESAQLMVNVNPRNTILELERALGMMVPSLKEVVYQLSDFERV